MGAHLVSNDFGVDHFPSLGYESLLNSIHFHLSFSLLLITLDLSPPQTLNSQVEVVFQHVAKLLGSDTKLFPNSNCGPSVLELQEGDFLEVAEKLLSLIRPGPYCRAPPLHIDLWSFLGLC